MVRQEIFDDEDDNDCNVEGFNRVQSVPIFSDVFKHNQIYIHFIKRLYPIAV